MKRILVSIPTGFSGCQTLLNRRNWLATDTVMQGDTQPSHFWTVALFSFLGIPADVLTLQTL